MVYAIISDIHGNVDALRATLNDIGQRNVDSVICLGDIVGYYPDPEECIKLVRENASYCVAGNHDYAAIGRIDTRNFTYYAFAAIEWTKKHLSDDSKAFLESLPLTVERNGMYFTHSSPSNPQDWVYVFPDSEEAVFEAFNCLVYRMNFIGHTHWPSIIVQDDDKIILHSDHCIRVQDPQYYLINVGSVGQPRDFDSRSCYAIYDSESKEFALIRVKYDYGVMQRKVEENNLPQFLAERLAKGR